MIDLFRAHGLSGVRWSLSALASLLAASASAQSFDCAKATPPIETAICASTDLRAQDNALAGAYARAQYNLREDAQKLDELKAAQRRWIADRNRACAADLSKLATCLADSYRTRLAAIAQAIPTVAAAQPQPQQSAQPQPTQPVPAQTASAAPPPVAQAVTPPPPPALAPIAPPSLPADRDASALLTIPAPGRYAIRTQSQTGVAIQLVDMIAGPGDVAGAAGVRDGRLDLLLDKGVYKLRTSGAKGASGQVALRAEQYRDLAPPAPLPADRPFVGDLGDLEQRSFWIDVDAPGRVAVEAVGRALQDLRLWRDGEQLSALNPDIVAIETKPGRAMTRARIEGIVERGRYLVTAYGGEPRVWPDGGADKPFMIRQLSAGSVAMGLAEATVGAFGSVRFEAPADFDTFRIEVAQPAPVVMTVKRAGAIAAAVLAKNSREIYATAKLAAANREPAIVEISGLQGQAFRLRGLRAASDLRVAGAGPTAVFVDVAGEGGDEIPATAVLVKFEGAKSRVLASDAPKIGPGQAWRRRFNLRGASTILFEMTAPGPVALRAQGPAIRAAIEPVLGAAPPRADGRAPAVWSLDAGVYQLRLTPATNAVGAIDLTLGQPGMTPEVGSPPAARAALSLGVHQIERGAVYQALVNSAPSLATGVRAVASPVDLGKGPLAVWQGLTAPSATPAPRPAPAPQIAPQPRQGGAPTPPARPTANPPRPTPISATAPAAPQPPRVAQAPAQQPQQAPSAPTPSADAVLHARAPLGGTIFARDQRGAEVAVSISDEKAEKDFRTFTLRIPASATPRAVAVFWRAPPPPRDPGQGASPQLETIAAGAPRWFDLAENQRREFRIEAKDGGLYRIETLGRLVTNLTIGTNFLPKLGEAADNGPGRNALAQAYLRAGAYRVAVTAKDSSGRVGLAATPAAMQTTGALSADGSVRATLVNGRGAITPIEIRQAGDYRLDLYGLGRDLSARLEDAEGWPITAPGPLTRLDLKLEAGKYRLVVPPVDVEARMVARLRPVAPQKTLEGHGPHPLVFGADQKFQWREPQGKDAPRTPDAWTFALAGEANVDLTISEGMIGELIRGEKESVGKFVASRPFAGKLAAGAYRVEARALGRDDRLDYTLSLNADELQPGAARFVDLPAKLDFVIAEDRVVNLTSFGRKDLKGVLRDANGAIVERLAGRADDWNIALSRRLASGRYTLALSEMTADAASAAAENTPDEPGDEEEGGGDEAAADAGDAQPAPQADPPGVEIRFALPTEAAPQPLAADGAASVAGANVHRFALPPQQAGALTLVAARSDSELVLSIETRDNAQAQWRVIGFERGQAPLVAWPAPQKSDAEWRASVWSIDGASAPIAIVARNVTREAQAGPDVTFEPHALDAVQQAPRIALLRAPAAAIVDVAGAGDALLAGSSAGRALSRAESGPLAPQSERLWFVARDAALQPLAAPALAWSGGEIALSLDSGETAHLPAPALASGKARVWRARSAFGQPGLDAGAGMAVADNAALALAAAQPLRVWNAGGADALRVDLDSIELALAPKAQLAGELATLLPPRSALPVTLPDGDKRLDLDLAAETGAFAAPGESGRFAVAAAGAALSRTANASAKEIWLVNLADKPQPVRLALAPGRLDAIAPDRIVKRFHGAGGSTALRVDAQKGDLLRVEGADATFVAQSGAVLRGATLTLDGAGDVALDYKPGLVAAWIERAGASPWPKAEARTVATPASVRLEGAAMAFALKQDQPALIGLRTSAPVAVAIEQGGRRELKLYPAGADFHRYVAPGDAIVTVYSPHDGALSGALDLTATPVRPIREGLGEPVALAPGASALFGFEVKRAAEIGIGLRAEPDRIDGRLLDASGKPVGDGLSQIGKLAPGRYVLEARVPVDAPPTIVRPAVIGLDPPAAGPPPEEIEQYLAKAGFKTNTNAR